MGVSKKFFPKEKSCLTGNPLRQAIIDAKNIKLLRIKFR